MDAISGVLAYVVGPGIVTVGTAYAAKTASRGAEKAAEITKEAEEDTSAVAGYHQLVTDLQVDVRRLRTDHDDLRQEHSSLREEHEEIKSHVRILEEKASKDRSLIRRLVIHIRVLRRALTENSLPVPELPRDLEEEILGMS